MPLSNLDLQVQSSITEYIHKTWVSLFAPPLLYLILTEDKRGKKRLSRAILKESFSSSSEKYWFVASKNSLFQLIKYCGLAANHSLLLKLIDKREVKLIRLIFGEDSYDFLSRYVPLSCPYSFPHLRLKNLYGIHDQVFRTGLRLLYWCIEEESVKSYIKLATPMSMKDEAKRRKPSEMEMYLSLFEKVKQYLDFRELKHPASGQKAPHSNS